MYPGAPNPIQIQFAPLVTSDNGKSGLPPLVLVHDSSGTTFNYFALGDLERDVWAIHDPNHWEGSVWEGGLNEMADHYIRLIEAAGISGPVVLGGWSFGGFVAIAMAHMLATGTASVTTTALLLIDTPYVFSTNGIDATISNTTGLNLNPASLNDLPDLVLKSMVRSDTMLEKWNLPTWKQTGPENKSNLLDISRHQKSENGKATSIEQDIDLEYRDSEIGPTIPPPTLLVRCKRYVYDQEKPSDRFLVDLHRHEKLLGWENGYPGLIKSVIEVDADHYNVFDMNNSSKMESLTSSLKETLASISALDSV